MLFATGLGKILVFTKVLNSQQPLFSIIIPVRNEGQYIIQTLSNILRQVSATKLAAEIIIVDGGSEDDTVAACEALGVRLIRGIARAQASIAGGRNVGAEASVGEILFHTDADVRIPNLVKLLTEVQRCFTDLGYVAATTRILPHSSEARLRDHVMHAIFNYCIRCSIPLGAFLAKGECQIVKRSAFVSAGGYNEKIVVGEDCALFHNIRKLGKIKYLGNFCVTHSTRRFRRYGYIKLLSVYAREAFFLVFLRRNYLSRWEEIR
jgi:glycosyltransferase involved in cell wall biosynthesis